MKNAEASLNIPDKEWRRLEEKILVAEMVRIGVIVMMNEKTSKNYAPLHMNRSFNASKRMETKMMAKSN